MNMKSGRETEEVAFAGGPAACRLPYQSARKENITTATV